MPEPTSEFENESLPASADRSVIGWAFDDLDRFESETWSGSHAIMGPEMIRGIREAARIVTGAFRDGVIVFAGPDTEEYEAKIAQLGDELTAYTNGYDRLKTAVEGTLVDFEDGVVEIEVYGGGDNPVGKAVDDISENLTDALAEAKKEIAKVTETP